MGSDIIRQVVECSICSQVPDSAHAFEKGGLADPEDNTSLPVSADQFKRIKKVPNQARTWVKQCPECGAYFLYSYENEFIADGHEHSEELKRISKKETEKLLRL